MTEEEYQNQLKMAYIEKKYNFFRQEEIEPEVEMGREEPVFSTH